MQPKFKIASLITSSFLAANMFVPAVFVGANANTHVALNDKAGMRPGLEKKFFEKAAIGTGQVTAKSATTLTVSKNGKSFTVLTDSKTQFRRRFRGKSSLAEINVGDTVNVIGKWTDDSHTTIQARLVRDLSVQKMKGVFFGEVISLTANGWIMKTKRGNETVTVNASTVFKNRKEETIARADIKVGHRVRVSGVWDATRNQISEVTKVKDFSLPVRAAATP